MFVNKIISVLNKTNNQNILNHCSVNSEIFQFYAVFALCECSTFTECLIANCSYSLMVTNMLWNFIVKIENLWYTWNCMTYLRMTYWNLWHTYICFMNLVRVAHVSVLNICVNAHSFHCSNMFLYVSPFHSSGKKYHVSFYSGSRD